MASKYAKDFKIPEGFPLILKDFTRDVLSEVNQKGLPADEKSINEFAYR